MVTVKIMKERISKLIILQNLIRNIIQEQQQNVSKYTRICVHLIGLLKTSRICVTLPVTILPISSLTPICIIEAELTPQVFWFYVNSLYFPYNMLETIK